MAYSYQTERPRLFTEEGQEMLMRVYDKAMNLIDTAGAVRMDKLFGVGSTWDYLACVDRLIEMKKLREVTPQGSVMGQYRVFVAHY